MLLLLNTLQLLLYIGLLALLGQAVLFVITGQNREANMFYQLMQVLNKPWIWGVKKITPSKVAERHHPFVAFFVLSILYIAVTLAKIEHCIAILMQGCR